MATRTRKQGHSDTVDSLACRRQEGRFLKARDLFKALHMEFRIGDHPIRAHADDVSTCGLGIIVENLHGIPTDVKMIFKGIFSPMMLHVRNFQELYEDDGVAYSRLGLELSREMRDKGVSILQIMRDLEIEHTLLRNEHKVAKRHPKRR